MRTRIWLVFAVVIGILLGVSPVSAGCRDTGDCLPPAPPPARPAATAVPSAPTAAPESVETAPTSPPESVGINDVLPTDDLPRAGDYSIILVGPVWNPLGYMTTSKAYQEWQDINAWVITEPQYHAKYGQAVRDRDELWAFYVNGGYQAAQQNNDDESQPAPTSAPSPSPAAASGDCNELRALLAAAQEKAKEIAKSLRQVEGRIATQKSTLEGLIAAERALVRELAAAEDLLVSLQEELAKLQAELRDEPDRETRSRLMQSIQEVKGEIQDTKAQIAGIESQIETKHGQIIIAQDVLGDLESDRNDLTATGRYWLAEVERLRALVAKCA